MHSETTAETRREHGRSAFRVRPVSRTAPMQAAWALETQARLAILRSHDTPLRGPHGLVVDEARARKTESSDELPELVGPLVVGSPERTSTARARSSHACELRKE